MSKANHKNEERSENFCNYSNENKKTEEKCEDDSTNETSSPYSNESHYPDSPEIVSLKSLTTRYTKDDLAPSPVGVESSQTGGNKCAADAEQKMDISLNTKDCCNNLHNTDLTGTVKSLPEIQELVTTNISHQAIHELALTLRSDDTISITDVHLEAQKLNCVSSPQIQPTLTSETDWTGYTKDDLAPSPVGVESSQTGGNKCAADAEQKMDISLNTKDCCNNHHSTEMTGTVKSLPEIQELVTINISHQAIHELALTLRSDDTISITDVHLEAQKLNCVSSPQIQPTLTSETDWTGRTEDCPAPRPAIVETSLMQDDKHAIDKEEEIDTSHITKGKLPRTYASNQKPPYSKQEDIGDLSNGGNLCVKQKCYFKTKNLSVLKILFAFILALTGAQLQGNSSLNIRTIRTVPVGTQATIYCIFEKDIDFSKVGHISLQLFNASGSDVAVMSYFGRDDNRNFMCPSYAVDYNKTNSTTLAVSINATSEKHEGTYECQAENNMHITTIPSKLIVIGQPSINESNSTSSSLTIDKNASEVHVAVAVAVAVALVKRLVLVLLVLFIRYYYVPQYVLKKLYTKLPNH